ncbi:MAG: hypothetical protein E7618_07525 [Ruminococcaceae bacterium]|nr:hypothetical protein [Oscillospiraceae bacterium]
MATADFTLDSAYLALRRTVLTAESSDDSATVSTVCVDYHFENALLTLISRADGTVGLYRAENGDCLGIEAPSDSVSAAVLALHRVTADCLSHLQRENTDAFPFPIAGRLSLRAVTNAGVFSLFATMKDRCRVEIQDLFFALNQLLLCLFFPQGFFFGLRDAVPLPHGRRSTIHYLDPVLRAPIASFLQTEKASKLGYHLSIGHLMGELVKPWQKDYHRYRATVLTLPPPDTLRDLAETVAYAALLEQRGHSSLRMVVLRLSGTVDLLQESSRPAMGADRSQAAVIRAVRSFLHTATQNLPHFSREKEGAHPFPTYEHTLLRLITNRGIYVYRFPNGHPEQCPLAMQQLANRYFLLLDTLQY